MNNLTKVLLGIGIILLVYGYLCRILHIYFFWDSKELGWVVLFIALLFYLFGLHRSRRLQRKRTVGVIIGIFFISFGLLISPFVLLMLKTSDAYQAAIDYFETDPQIKDSFGEIKGFGLIPTGQFQSKIINGIESGDAEFIITIKGDKKYKDVSVRLKKTPETNWSVISIE